MTKEYVLKEILSWAKMILLAVLAALFVSNVLIVNAEIPSGSMENTIMTNDRLVAFRLSYLFSEPERFDIVVFKYPDDEEILYIKRIIGLPGETIEFVNGNIYVDDEEFPLDENFMDKKTTGMENGIYVVPKDHYFMLGDNREHSGDSREWENKFVSKEKILGKGIFRYFPKFTILIDK